MQGAVRAVGSLTTSINFNEIIPFGTQVTRNGLGTVLGNTAEDAVSRNTHFSINIAIRGSELCLPSAWPPGGLALENGSILPLKKHLRSI